VSSTARIFAPLTLVAFMSAAAPARATPPVADPDPWFGRDKALHFGVSAGITGAAYGITALASDDIRIRIAFGAGVGVLAGAAKELADLAGLGDPSWKDFTWDLIGTAVGVGIAISIDIAVRGLHPKAAAAH
jgi:putative lipoprotein